MREAVMSGMVLADDSLINLFPDPAWDVAGFRDLAGGVIAVCLYAAVAMVIVGVLTLLPGLITNNMMERAFSWKRLLCALMIPLTIGAATGGFAWGAGAFGADGLAVNDSYQSANGHPDWKGVKSDEAKKSDDLGGVVRQLGEDIANRVGKAAGDAIDKALSTGKKAWQWLSGGDGKGNTCSRRPARRRATPLRAPGTGCRAGTGRATCSRRPGTPRPGPGIGLRAATGKATCSRRRAGRRATCGRPCSAEPSGPLSASGVVRARWRWGKEGES